MSINIGDVFSGLTVTEKAGLSDKSEAFVLKAKEVHGDKYDYSLVDYTRNDRKVVIVCPEHGKFEQRPNNHLDGKGCLDCSVANKSHTFETFISKSKILYSDAYDYSEVEFIRLLEPVTIRCRKHGYFQQTPKHHLSKNGGCPACSKDSILSRRQEEFIRRSVEKYGDRYDYSKVIYQGMFIPVKIGCAVHGEYLKIPNNHLNGSHCPKCSSEERASRLHWDYLERCKLDEKLANSDAVLYLLKLKGDNESFLKVGVSSSFNSRLPHYKKDGMTYEILEVVNTTAIQAALLEREVLKYIRENDFRYIPDKVFGGWTECATLESKERLLEIFKEFNNNE